MCTPALVQTCLGDARPMLTATVSGACRCALPPATDWAPLSVQLKQHDLEMTYADGTATFRAQGDTAQVAGAVTGTASALSAGPLEVTTTRDPVCTSADLDALIATSGVLRVSLGDRRLEVVRVRHSDVRDGLSHLHRRGRVLPRTGPQRNSTHTCRQSHTGKAFQTRRSRWGAVAKAMAALTGGRH